MSLIELNELYNTDETFKEYVDKYCQCHRMLAEDAIKAKIVQNYAAYLKGGKQ